MTFANIDDQFDDHPKYAEYGAAEMGVIACAITKANRNLSDGVIPRAWPEQRFGKVGREVAKRLVNDGTWLQLPSGAYEIVGFLEHNSSRADVLSERARIAESKSKAGKAGGIKSGIARRAQAQARSAIENEQKRSSEPKQPVASVQAADSSGIERNEALSSPILSDPTLPSKKTQNGNAGFALESQVDDSIEVANRNAFKAAYFECYRSIARVDPTPWAAKEHTIAKQLVKRYAADAADICRRMYADTWWGPRKPSLSDIQRNADKFRGVTAAAMMPGQRHVSQGHDRAPGTPREWTENDRVPQPPSTDPTGAPQ